MLIKPEAVRDILVVRNDRFGELLLNIPALRALKETFRLAKITVVLSSYAQDLGKDIPFIDAVIAWERKRHSLAENLRLLRIIKAGNFDAAVMLNPSKEFNILTYLAGIKIRVGYDRKWGFLLNFRMKDRKYLGEKHEIEYNLDLVGLIGAKTGDMSLTFNVNGCAPKEETADIIIHPFTSDSVKQWPIENFISLAKRLAIGLGLRIAIVGGKEEANLAYLFDGLGPGIINLIGKTSLNQLASLLRCAKLLISCDSGPVHLASCVGIRVLALFRNDLPGKTSLRWGPRSSGSRVIEKYSFEEISVDEVFKQAKEMLALTIWGSK